MRRFIKSVSTLCIVMVIAAPWTSLADILVVEVANIQSPGELHIAIYDDAKAFQGDKGEKGGPAEGIIDGVIQEVSGEAVSFRFELPEGRYAIGVSTTQIVIIGWTPDSLASLKNNLGLATMRWGVLVHRLLRRRALWSRAVQRSPSR